MPADGGVDCVGVEGGVGGYCGGGFLFLEGEFGVGVEVFVEGFVGGEGEGVGCEQGFDRGGRCHGN